MYRRITWLLIGIGIVPLLTLIMYLINMVFPILKSTGLVSFLIIMVVIYAVTGYFLGGKLSDTNHFIDGILFGIGPFLWSVVFFFVLGWIRETGPGLLLMVLPLVLLTLFVSVVSLYVSKKKS